MKIDLMKKTMREFKGNSEHAAMHKAENFIDEMFYAHCEEWTVVEKKWRVTFMLNTVYTVTVAKVEPYVTF